MTTRTVVGFEDPATVHVSISKLGSKASGTADAAKAVVDYLTGHQTRHAGQRGAPEPTLTTETTTAGGYYADSATNPGRWHGRGAEQMIPPESRGHVDAEMLERVLLGQHPVTGEQLVKAAGSAGRASHNNLAHVTVAATGPGDELLSAEQAAKLVGVEKRYINHIAKRTADHHHAAATAGPDQQQRAMPATYLNGHKVTAASNKQPEWRFERREIERFKARRKEPDVIMGYDLTYSVPKSISIAWAAADNTGRDVIEDALHTHAVNKAMGYIETEAISVRHKRRQEPGDSMIAASFLHDTNRELEPQLHVHVVLANMAAGGTGNFQALDGRSIYIHAGTSGHLAEAELQSVLNRHGYRFGETTKGIAHLIDVPQAAVDSLSTRRAQIMDEVGAVGADSPAARQMAAYATRAAKTATVDRDELTELWLQRLADTGLGPTELDQLQRHDPPPLWTPADTARLDRHLSSAEGVTKHAAIFERRNVIETITDHSAGRLNADEVVAHSDRWLGTNAAIALGPTNRTKPDQLDTDNTTRASLNPNVTYYTTPHMVRIETHIADAYNHGHNTAAALVHADIVNLVTNQWQHRTGHTLGKDQTAMVAAITSSGDQFQAVVGPAGSGKTAALEVAARAWEHAGHRLYGVAVNGNAAQILERQTGIESTTVAGFLKRFEDPDRQLEPNAVIIVDEASTLGNRQHQQLVALAQRDGAAMRTVGDPAQHNAIDAGGMWAHLVTTQPERAAHLTQNRRMNPETMHHARLAVTDYRNGKIAAALERLDDDNRMVTAATSAELLDDLAADWYVDWRQHLANPETIKPSRMLAENHTARRALNTRAQTLLKADGILIGDPVKLGDSHFHVGDQVIARAQNRQLKPDGADTRSYVRNGTKGTVIEIGDGPEPDLVVDFENRGPITVDHNWLSEPLRPGVTGGLTPAYAMTTHAAQGDTYSVSRPLLTDRSTPEGVYVALTRGEHDLRLYSVEAEAFTEPTPTADHGLPIVDDDRPLDEKIVEQLTKTRRSELATVADAGIADVLPLVEMPLSKLDAITSAPARRATRIIEELAYTTIAADPPAPLIALIGHRNPNDAAHWDNAARRYAVYNQRWNVTPSPGQVAPLPPPHGPARQHNDYEQLTTSVIAARAHNSRHLEADQLAATRADIVNHLNRLPASEARTHTATIAALKSHITDLQADIAHHNNQHDTARTPAERRTNPDGAERARRKLEACEQKLGIAQAQLVDLTATRAASPATAAARERSRIELGVIDTLIDGHAAAALTSAQPYRHQALGERPRQPDAAQHWDHAARSIETYRIGQLGQTPDRGPIDTGARATAVEAAIGPRPNDTATSAHWDLTNKTIHQLHHGAELDLAAAVTAGIAGPGRTTR